MGRLMRDFWLDTLKRKGGKCLTICTFPLWSSGSKDPYNTNGDATFEVKEPEFEVKNHESEVHVAPSSSAKTKKHDDKTKREAKVKSHVELSIGFRNLSEEFDDFTDNSINEVNAASTPVPAVGQISTNSTNTFNAAGPSNTDVSPTLKKSSYVDPSQYPDDQNIPALEDITYSDDDEDVSAEADFTNLETTITVSPIPTTRVHKDHHINNKDFHTCMFSCFLSQEEAKRVHQALKDPSWIEAMQEEELLQFKLQNVWVLVDLPNRKRAIDSIDCLPNEEIFTELARMGYEKPSTKLTFYKAFFSTQWKFLIHIILQCMSAKRTAWNEFSSFMASAVICLAIGRKFNFSKYIFDSLVRNVDSSSKFYMYPRFLQLIIHAQVGDLSFHSTKYSSLALTQKVFSNMRWVGKGFSRVNTPPLEGMLVPHQAADDVADVVADSVPANNVAAVVIDDVIANEIKEEEKVKRVWVEKIKEGRIIELIDADDDVTLEEVDTAKDVEVDKNADVQGRQEESQAHAYHRDLEHVDKVLSMHDDELEPAKLKEVIKVVTTAKLMTKVATAAAATTITVAPSAARRRKGVVIRDPEETATPSTIVHSVLKSKDKGKGILVEEPKPLKKQAQIEQDKAYARELEAELNKNINWDDVIEQVKRKEKEDNAVLRYQALKRKPQQKLKPERI
uniref:Uncharacterized protein n=1 Tax=Tanacetum cinerariifolium TaxID=118510 RepID=A0A6L2J8V0_TANCI|nr:hypothetical protein [Tanacetum cinerariifolium]